MSHITCGLPMREGEGGNSGMLGISEQQKALNLVAQEVSDIETEKLLWREVAIDSIRKGQAGEEAVKAADTVANAYHLRFRPKADGTLKVRICSDSQEF